MKHPPKLLEEPNPTRFRIPKQILVIEGTAQLIMSKSEMCLLMAQVHPSHIFSRTVTDFINRTQLLSLIPYEAIELTSVQSTWILGRRSNLLELRLAVVDHTQVLALVCPVLALFSNRLPPATYNRLVPPTSTLSPVATPPVRPSTRLLLPIPLIPATQYSHERSLQANGSHIPYMNIEIAEAWRDDKKNLTTKISGERPSLPGYWTMCALDGRNSVRSLCPVK